MTGSAFRIRQAALDVLVAHARSELPAECCGLLIGAGATIEEAVRAHNLAGSPTRFLLDPKDHIDARREARRRGLDVLGFYHSHPRSPAFPSPIDIAEASYPDAVYLIVSLEGAVAETRLFQLDGDTATELPLVAVP